MGIIETAEGESLVVENHSRGEHLWVSARLDCDRAISHKLEEKLYTIYKQNALRDRPRSRGDLTAEAVREIADLLVGHAVAVGWADRRSDVHIERVTLEERQAVERASHPLVPDHEEGWPEDGSASDKVRYMLDAHPTLGDDEIAAAADCSRSLVSDVKNRD